MGVYLQVELLLSEGILALLQRSLLLLQQLNGLLLLACGLGHGMLAAGGRRVRLWRVHGSLQARGLQAAQ